MTNVNEKMGDFCTYRHVQKIKMSQIVLSLFISIVFVQSLFFKFSDAPETQFIFAILDAWAADYFTSGLFNPGGIFSAKVIGSFELISSALLLLGLANKRVLLRVAGSGIALAIISGAIFFHLFTPLGVEVQGDGGLLFMMACGVWLSAAYMLYTDRHFINHMLFSR
jgi:hypothetical protein